MSNETVNNVLHSAGELHVETEITLHPNGDQSFAENNYSVQVIAECAKTLINEERFEAFRQLLLLFNNEDKFRSLMEDETFLVVYLKYKMHRQLFQDVFQILQTMKNTYNPAFLQLWDEAHYQQYWTLHGKLSPGNKFRIRQRNPPPPGICPDGVRPPVRLSKKSLAVLREWFSRHATDPYPCKKVKQALAKRAGIPSAKVTSWFSNARRQQKKNSRKKGELKGEVNPDKSVNGKETTKEDKCVGTDELIHTDMKEYDAALEHPYVGNWEFRKVKGQKIDENYNCMVNKDTNLTGTVGPSLYSFNNRTVIDLPALSNNWPATVQSVYKLEKSIDVKSRESCNNAMDTNTDQRVPFSQVQLKGDGHRSQGNIELKEETSAVFERSYWNPHYTNEKTGYIQREYENKLYTEADTGYRQGYTIYIIPKDKTEAMTDGKASVMTGSLAEPVTGTKIKTMGGKENEVLKRTMEEVATEKKEMYEQTQYQKAQQENAEVTGIDVNRCSVIQPELNFEETYTEMRVNDWNPTGELTEWQKKFGGIKRAGGIYEESVTFNCLTSLQKLCNNIETNVESPLDFACTADIEIQQNDLDDDTVVERDLDIMNDAKSAITTKTIEKYLNLEISNGMIDKCFRLNAESNGEPQRRSLSENATYNMPERKEQEWYTRDNTTEEYPLSGTRVDLSANCSSQRTRSPTSIHPYLQSDQMVPSLSGDYSCYQPSATDMYRLNDTDWARTLSPWNILFHHEFMSWAWMKATSTDDNPHCCARNLGSCGTVVGDAVEGLLNLSSSQESNSY